MNKTSLLLASALLVAAPLSAAHVDGGVDGTPKTYCENFAGDINVHDYTLSRETTFFLGPPIDGAIGDCDLNGSSIDGDGHSEYALGGAHLLVTDTPPNAGLGATACYGERPHHPAYPDVWVDDPARPSGVTFLVAADSDLVLGNFCGDGIDDRYTDSCVDQCLVDIDPGLDGAYRVYVIPQFLSDDGPVDTTQTSDQSGPGVVCLQDPTDPAFWICIYTDRLPGTSDAVNRGHVYT